MRAVILAVLGTLLSDILIAHRYIIVKNFDTTFLLDKIELKDKGRFEELIKNNDQF